MSKITALWSKEPALVVGLVQAIIALAVSFGLDLSTAQIGAIMAVVAAFGALLTRSQVSSTPPAG